MIYIIFVKLEVHTVTRYLSQMKRISIGERTHATQSIGHCTKSQPQKNKEMSKQVGDRCQLQHSSGLITQQTSSSSDKHKHS